MELKTPSGQREFIPEDPKCSPFIVPIMEILEQRLMRRGIHVVGRMNLLMDMFISLARFYIDLHFGRIRKNKSANGRSLT